MTTPSPATRTLVVEREMAHPPEKVWRALTQGPLIEEWLMQNDFEPIVGRRFTLRTAAMAHWNGVTDCELLELIPHQRLSYRWDASGDEAATGLKTVVTWTLTPTPTGVRVRMEQSGFRPQDEGNYQGAVYGWQRIVGSLEQVVSLLEN
ncbi:MAG: SRPBCC domain-containing protein [Rhizobacter sp.]